MSKVYRNKCKGKRGTAFQVEHDGQCKSNNRRRLIAALRKACHELHFCVSVILAFRLDIADGRHHLLHSP